LPRCRAVGQGPRAALTAAARRPIEAAKTLPEGVGRGREHSATALRQAARVSGFARNLFAAFGYAILPYAFVWGWLTFVHLAPVTLLALHAALPERVPADPTPLAASVALSLATWTLTYVRLRLPTWPALLYPLTFVAFLVVVVRSFFDGFRRRATWKGRPLARPPTRWL
jgi:hypothetical protein